jgi:DNA-directed RNA polymerase subunit E'/Rpb7
MDYEITEKKPTATKRQKIQSIYSRCLITRNILLPITSVSRNIGEIIGKYIDTEYAGKCLVEGFVKPGSIKIVSYSAGTIQKGDKVAFQVVFECEVCFLVEGMLIQCKVVNITKAGIRAETETSPSPLVVFVARDHNYNHPKFNSVQEGDIFTARVIGQRFELNDKYISAIATLI